MNKRAMSVLSKLCISMALIALMIWRIDIRELKTPLWNVDGDFLLLALIALFFQGLHGGYLWKLILRQMGHDISFAHITKISMIGGFFGFFVPSSLGVDMVRTAIMSRHIKSLIVVISSTLVLRGVMFLVLISMGMVGGLISVNQGTNSAILAPVLSFYFCILGGVILFSNSNIQRIIRLILDKLNLYKLFEKAYQVYSLMIEFNKHKKFILFFIFSATLNQIINILNIYFIARAVGINEIGFCYYLIYVPIVWTLTMLPISIAGIGVREGAFVAIYSFAGITSPLALSVSFLVLAETILYAIAGGILYCFCIATTSEEGDGDKRNGLKFFKQ